MISNPYQQYQNNSVLTAPKEELTLMLYNGAIKFCNQSIEALEKNDISKAHINNIKVQDIIIELQATLDTKYPVTKEIDLLYTFIRELLIEANMKKDKEKMQQAKELITDFRDLWKEVVLKAKKGA